MGYRVYYEEMFTVVDQVNNLCNTWLDTLQTIQSKEQTLAETKYIKGKTADNIKQYLAEVHEIVLTHLMVAVQNYQYAIGDYASGYKRNVDGGNASGRKGNYCYNTLVYDELSESGIVPRNFRDFEYRTQSLHEEVCRVRNSVSDLISLPSSKGENLLNALGRAKEIANTTHDKVMNYENSRKADLDHIDEALNEIRSIIYNQLSNKRTPVAKYTSGTVASMCSIEKLATAAQYMLEDTEAMQDGYLDGVNSFSEMQEYKDYEARAKKAVWIKWGVGIVAGVATAVVTVATGGLAAVAICGFIGAAEGAAYALTDIYVNKGKGTSFISNVFSKDFYDRFDARDIASLIKGATVGGIKGMISGGFAGDAGAFRTTRQKMLDNVLKSEANVVVDGFSNIVETVAIGAIEGRSSDEIYKEVMGEVKDTLKNSVTTGIKSITGTVVNSGFEKINTNFIDGKLLKNTGDLQKKAVNTLLVKPIERINSGNVDRFIDESMSVVYGDKQSVDWDNVFDAGSMVRDGAGEMAIGGAKEVSKKVISDQQQFKAKLQQSALREDVFNPNHVEVVTFGDGVDGVLKKDYENAYERAGKGAYKDKTLQEMLGVSYTENVSIENAHVSDVKIDQVRDTRTYNESGRKINIQTEATSATIPFSEVIERGGKK